MLVDESLNQSFKTESAPKMSMDHLDQELNAVTGLRESVKLDEAEALMKRLIARLSLVQLSRDKDRLLRAIEEFLPKRRRGLAQALQNRLLQPVDLAPPRTPPRTTPRSHPKRVVRRRRIAQ
jgi:hypothetical protein